jgi:hypothetical protein
MSRSRRVSRSKGWRSVRYVRRRDITDGVTSFRNGNDSIR